MFRKVLKWLLYLSIAVAIAYGLFIIIVRPSNNRNWSLDQQILPQADIVPTGTSTFITIHNIRDFRYQSTSTYTPGYYDKTFDLAELKTVDYLVEPFKSFGSAHTLLTFGFSNGDRVAISVEIRKEKGETFSPVKGLFRRYELMYVIADERDVIALRTNYRKDKVYLYPVTASKEKMEQLFLDMVMRANTLAAKPEFYNTLTNTCTTNIVSHINDITEGRVPLSYKVLMPAYSDQLAYDLGLIDTSLSFAGTKEKYFITEKAQAYGDGPNFSEVIRTP